MVFGNPDRAKQLRSWSNFGFSHSRTSISLGTNAKMDELTAAFLHAQLDDWERISKDWMASRSIVKRLSEEYELKEPEFLKGVISPYWIVELSSREERDAFESLLEREEVETRKWWGEGCHQMKVFDHINRSSLPVTESVAGRTLGLPFYRHFDNQVIEKVSRVFSEWSAGVK